MKYGEKLCALGLSRSRSLNSPLVTTPSPSPSSFDAVVHTQESTHIVPCHKRFLLVVARSSAIMRLAEHVTALPAWCKQCRPGW